MTGGRDAYCSRCAGIVASARKAARDWAVGQTEKTYEAMKAKEAELIREWTAKKPDDDTPRAGVQSWPAIEQPGDAT